jgi:hypothetical protein
MNASIPAPGLRSLALLACLMACSAGVEPPPSPTRILADHSLPLVAPLPLDATVTTAGEVVSVSRADDRALTLRVVRDGREHTNTLVLDMLRDGTRIEAVRLGPYLDGLAMGLHLVKDGVHDYRYLVTASDILSTGIASELFTDPVATGKDPWQPRPWTLSPSLFTTSDAPYRIVDISRPGGDELELTFRRAGLVGVRDRNGQLTIDERIFRDVCAGAPMVAKGKSTLVKVVTLAYADG